MANESQQIFLAHSGDGVVATCELSADGFLTETARRATGPGSSALALDGPRNRLFVSVRTEPPTVATFGLDADGVLTPIGSSPAGGSLNYLTVDATGTTLLAVSYSGGFGVTMPIGMDGVVGAPTSRTEYRNLHSVIVSPDNRHAYLAALGDDLIAQFALVDEVLSPLDPPTVAAPDRSGPRHLVLNAEGTNLYCVTEFSGEAIRYLRDPATGTLTQAESLPFYDESRGLGHSEFGVDPVENHYIWGADVHLSPEERFLFCSERCESTLGTLSLDADGRLLAKVAITDTEKQPRAFGVAESGHLVVLGEKSQEVSVYAIESDGALRRTCRVPGGSASNWVTVRR